MIKRRHIQRVEGESYMRRWCVRLPFGFEIRLHVFDSPDDSYHDHPWWFVAVAVRGSGAERLGVSEKDSRERVIRLFVPRFYRATDSHSVTRVDRLVTVVLCGRRIRRWGFWRDGVWVEGDSEGNAEVKA